MAGVRQSWLWPVAIMVSAVSLSLALVVSTVYRASSTSHDTTLYACLYAGSLSQVGTTEPASCGRGSKISWVSAAGSGATYWANVAADGTLLEGRGAVAATREIDSYYVTFETDVSGCAYSVTVSSVPTPSNPIFNDSYAVADNAFLAPSDVFVSIQHHDGTTSDGKFYLVVHCGADTGSN